MAGDGRHARHLLRRCRGCAGTAARTCPTRPSCSTSPTTASSSSSSRSGRRNSTSSPACWCWRRCRLFLVTSVAGRVWCGYTCPQTVWTDLMIVVERFLAGRPQRPHAPRQEPLGVRKALEESGRRISRGCPSPSRPAARSSSTFAMRRPLPSSSLTGTAPADRLCVSRHLHRSPPIVLGGIAREQVCIYMCPWPRIQGAMVDHGFAARHLPRLSRRAARTAQERPELGRTRRLHRLQGLRRRLPHGHRHPRRLAARMHSVRAVHRCLQRHHGAGSTGRDGLIAYDTFRNLEAAVHHERAPLRHRTAAHDPLFGAYRARHGAS